MNPKTKLVAWLRDAHAIEKAAEQTLTQQAKAAKSFPELAGRLNDHILMIHTHASRISEVLTSLGAVPSATEGAVAKFLGTMQTAAGFLMGDPVVTNVAAAYALKQLQIATYVAIVAAAEAAGEPEAAAVSREIIEDEERMADWLREYLPRLTMQYLAPVGGQP
jgi:ferritin-like metal-binding protein YciE